MVFSDSSCYSWFSRKTLLLGIWEFGMQRFLGICRFDQWPTSLPRWTARTDLPHETYRGVAGGRWPWFPLLASCRCQISFLEHSRCSLLRLILQVASDKSTWRVPVCSNTEFNFCTHLNHLKVYFCCLNCLMLCLSSYWFLLDLGRAPGTWGTNSEVVESSLGSWNCPTQLKSFASWMHGTFLIPYSLNWEHSRVRTFFFPS